MKRKQEYHNMSYSSEYRTWDNMIARCERKSNPYYHLYGGRGIKMHPAWRKSFVKFYEHVGDKPTPKHTIDRIDTDKGYEPYNVRWATPVQQNMNQRLRKDNKAGYRGVCRGYKSKWRANICVSGKTIYIGDFATKEVAAWMYDQFAVGLYDNPRTNFEYI